jgi:hypothetical protein
MRSCSNDCIPLPKVKLLHMLPATRTDLCMPPFCRVESNDSYSRYPHSLLRHRSTFGQVFDSRHDFCFQKRPKFEFLGRMPCRLAAWLRRKCSSSLRKTNRTPNPAMGRSICGKAGGTSRSRHVGGCPETPTRASVAIAAQQNENRHLRQYEQ